METGMIYNIQRYNIHDGDGIRTMIFLKGCPLRCPWCSNPESQSFAPQMLGDEMIGYEISAGEAAEIAARDRMFFRRSGGGVTLSGGEIMAQPHFAAELVERLKEMKINVTLETSCFALWEVFWQVAEKADTILADIKTMDSDLHLSVIGQPNEQILENIRRAAEYGKHIIVRVPVIPGFNNDEESLGAIAAFAAGLGIDEVHLLPYHELGKNKYAKLGSLYLMEGVRPPAKEDLAGLAEKLSSDCGIRVRVI